MNKRFSLFLLTTVLFVAFASAQNLQTEKSKFAIKVQTFKGSYLDKNHHFRDLAWMRIAV